MLNEIREGQHPFADRGQNCSRRRVGVDPCHFPEIVKRQG